LENQPKIELRTTNFAPCLPVSGLDAGAKTRPEYHPKTRPKC
jgi:hypothetical protein